MQLLNRTLKTTIIGLVVFCLLIFLPAGTLAYWQGWTFVAVFSVSTSIIGIYLALANPALLERRMKVGPAARDPAGAEDRHHGGLCGFLPDADCIR